MSELIPVEKGGETIEVHATTLQAHLAAGWRQCAKATAQALADYGERPDDAEQGEQIDGQDLDPVAQPKRRGRPPKKAD